MNSYKYFIYSFLLLFLIACSNADKNEIEKNSSKKDFAVINTPQVIVADNQSVTRLLVISSNGGCMMMGPNCLRYEVMSNGEFKVYRADESEVANSGKVDKILVEQWQRVADMTDFQDLLSNLKEGECKACYDGVDFSYIVYPDSKNIQMSSVDYEFSRFEDFFVVSEILHKAMRKTAPVEVISR